MAITKRKNKSAINQNASFPISIGGLGGSGTRLFAALLQHVGINIGSRLNAPLDNLWFTVLFKRAAWARGANPELPDPSDIKKSISLFSRAMTSGLTGQLERSELSLMESLRADLSPLGDWRCGANGDDVDDLMASVQAPDQPWGWKEPNTHIFLRQLDEHIPGFRYIHVVRDPMDMAFSKNTWQARHWSHLYGLRFDLDIPVSLRQLRYWTSANRAAIEYGLRHMPNRMLVVDYDDFCLRPQLHWQRMSYFLNPDEDLPFPEESVRPSSIGRANDYDHSVFNKQDMEAARAVHSHVAEVGQP